MYTVSSIDFAKPAQTEPTIDQRIKYAYDNVVTNCAILVGADARNKNLHRVNPDTPGIKEAQQATAQDTSMALEHLIAAVSVLNGLLIHAEPAPDQSAV